MRKLKWKMVCYGATGVGSLLYGANIDGSLFISFFGMLGVVFLLAAIKNYVELDCERSRIVGGEQD